MSELTAFDVLNQNNDADSSPHHHQQEEEGEDTTKPKEPENIFLNNKDNSSRRNSTTSIDNKRETSKSKRGNISQRSLRPSSSILVETGYINYINDMKYLGDQFKIGKCPPNIKSAQEEKFQKMYKEKMRKLMLKSEKSIEMAPLNTNRDLKALHESSIKGHNNNNNKTIDGNIFDDRFHDHVNDTKYVGDQFKVGKLQMNTISRTEKMFQEKRKNYLKSLSASTKSRNIPPQFTELKDIHEKLTKEKI
jgi:hypothetical protein